MERIIEYKAFSGGLKDLDTNKGIVTGYFASFNTTDRVKDIILPGAFTKTVKENGPKGTGEIAHLQDHNKNLTVAMIKELGEDSFGLAFESKVGRHDKGRNYMLMCEDGFIKSHSFEYAVIKSNKKGDIRYLSELKMTEGSGLQHGIAACNPNTPLTGIKALESLSDEEKSEYIFEQLKLYQKAWESGQYTDDHFINTIIPNLKAFTIEAHNYIQSVTPPEADTITSKGFNPTPTELKEIFKQNFTLK